MSTSGPTVTDCPIAATLEIVGEKWSLLILRDIARGLHKFGAIHASLGCARNLLSARLKTLEAARIIHTEAYQETGARARKAYHLTPTGADLLPVLLALQEWGQKHLGRTGGAHITHRDCGSEVHTTLGCSNGHTLSTLEAEVA